MVLRHCICVHIVGRKKKGVSGLRKNKKKRRVHWMEGRPWKKKNEIYIKNK